MSLTHPELTREFAEHAWQDTVIPTLKEYIPIPNKSPAFDPDWLANGYMHQAVKLLSRWVETRSVKGLTQRIVELEGRTPLLWCEIEASEPSISAETVLLYGHYDKQPEFSGWEEGLGPWLAVERDGKLYGRGGADDGYSIFSSLLAIEILQQQGIPHPRCVVLIEGCEESGSFDLPFYVDALKEEIGNPKLVICLDSECGNYDQLWTTTSLRGMLPGVLSVEILTEGQHSGVAGGIVPSTFRILRNVLERVEDADTGRLHDVLQVDIPEQVARAAAGVAQTLGAEITERFPWIEGAHAGNDDWADLVLENTWRPSLATVGLGGAPSIADAGNTLRPETATKLVFRLPPTLDAQTAATAIKQLLEESPPYGARVTFELEHPQTGWCAPESALWLQAATQTASSTYFGRAALSMGVGGTIPFMKMLGDAYPETQFFVTGVLGPKSNAHGPNEFLHIETGIRLTCCTAEILAASVHHPT